MHECILSINYLKSIHVYRVQSKSPFIRETMEGSKQKLQIQIAQVRIPALLLTSCVSLDNLLYLSVTQFPHLGLKDLFKD